MRPPLSLQAAASLLTDLQKVAEGYGCNVTPNGGVDTHLVIKDAENNIVWRLNRIGSGAAGAVLGKEYGGTE